MAASERECEMCGHRHAGAGRLCPECGGSETPPLSSGSSPTAPDAPAAWGRLAPGHVLGNRYTIVEQVGAGGMGRVYKALDGRLGNPVALKLVRPDIAQRPDLRERFRRELELARQVSHPNVCRLHDLLEADGLSVISMAFVEGQTLADLIRSVGRLSARQTLALGRQICDALAAIHEREIVHRDLKPQNIMVDRGGRPVVMDFGVAQQAGLPPLTDADRVMGTLAWLSPEQVHGQPASPRSDVYALGLVLFEMLTGVQAPGDRRPLPMALRETGEIAPLPSRLADEIPPAVDAVVARCLERDPARRFPDVRALRAALEEAETSLSTGTSPRRLRPPRRAGRRVALAGAAVAVLAVVAVTAGLLGGRPVPPARAERPDLALLPLDYVGPAGSVFLASAIPILMANRLDASPDASVAPFAASRAYSAREEAASLAAHLGVDIVVSGELRVEAGRAQVRLQAHDASGAQVWQGAEEVAIGDVLASADSLAAELLGGLGASRLGAAHGTRLDPRALALYVEGRRYLEGWEVDRNYARALASFEQALNLAPELGEARAGLALALWRSYEQTREGGFVERALATAEEAVERHPSLPEAQLALGVVQLGRGRSAEALDAFSRARQLAPADDQIPLRIAAAYAALGRNTEAAQMYDAAIALRPNHWGNYNQAGAHFLRLGELERAQRMFERVVELRPESDAGYNNLATVHLMAGEPLAAEPLLQAALRINPDAAGYANLGFVYYSTGRFRESAAEFQRAVAANPGDPVCWSNLGDAYRQLQEPARAAQAYQRGLDLTRGRLEVNPDDAEGRLGLAMLLAGLDRCGQVAGEIERGLAAAPERADLHYYAAVAAAVCGFESLGTRHLEAAARGGVVADAATNPDLRRLLGPDRLARLLNPGGGGAR